MNPRSTRLACALAGIAPLVGLVLVAPSASAATAQARSAEPDLYTGHVEVVRGDAADPEVLNGTVFDDRDEDSTQDRREKGIAGVTVSNGRDVVTTDGKGRYSIPAYDGMTVFVTQPAGYQVPVDEDKVAQFSYNHLPEGSPELKYGGIEPTGPLPEAVNFPLAKSKATGKAQQSCPIASDTQAYNMTEMGYARDGAVADLMDRDDYAGCGILMLGDNVGDDLSLNPALRDIYAEANGPIRLAPGNHDMDYDAADDTRALDTFRQQFGPGYYSYDVGQAHVVVLDNVIYNGAKEGGKNGGYKEAIDDQQLAWLEADLAEVPANKLVVVAAHAPIVDHRMVVTDNAAELYDVLEGRNAVTVGGHTHMLENLLPGDTRAEWQAGGVDELEHTQLVAGAVSGNWYSGGLDEQGLPYAFMTDGARPGVLTMELDGNEFSERYTIRGESDDLQLALGVNTPHWREWAAKQLEWRDGGKEGDAPALGDEGVVSAQDLAGDSWLTANFYAGSSDARVEVSIDGDAAVEAEHTQPMQGEALAKGWEYSDTFAATRNLLTSGGVTQSNAHLWRLPIPADLEAGTHTAEVTATDNHGREFTETLRFTVTDERPTATTTVLRGEVPGKVPANIGVTANN
ncbi:calcineurin-like phosphoesterase C-terminal domain-containing protein [Krasilnikoviella flava]|uniref:Calcineurin-like phosphoesterase n=1 Tax=Krasilnikoviella flava TaxID=526729 RepID=A0A1T5LY08_9MICO|nr:calcineurin-like phosphoesterase family protein [Krasilnikoviella flava]SKC80857.1 Calcineurin-like phosphoesterase [Krasilnikoviella flava]